MSGAAVAFLEWLSEHSMKYSAIVPRIWPHLSPPAVGLVCYLLFPNLSWMFTKAAHYYFGNSTNKNSQGETHAQIKPNRSQF